MEQLAAGERVDVSDVAPAQAVQQAPGSSVEFKSGADGFISANTDAGTVGGHIRSDGLYITLLRFHRIVRAKGRESVCTLRSLTKHSLTACAFSVIRLSRRQLLGFMRL